MEYTILCWGSRRMTYPMGAPWFIQQRRINLIQGDSLTEASNGYAAPNQDSQYAFHGFSYFGVLLFFGFARKLLLLVPGYNLGVFEIIKLFHSPQPGWRLMNSGVADIN